MGGNGNLTFNNANLIDWLNGSNGAGYVNWLCASMTTAGSVGLTVNLSVQTGTYSSYSGGSDNLFTADTTGNLTGTYVKGTGPVAGGGWTGWSLGADGTNTNLQVGWFL